MKVGVFGGSFDPVHLGHLVVAEAAAERLRLDQVRFVPAGRHPFKTGHYASPAHRVAMVDLAIRGNPRFLLDPREAERAGPSYTVDTLQQLRAEGPGDSLFLLIGSDAARELPAWHNVEDLAATAVVVVLTRPGFAAPAHPVIGRIVEVPGIDISATAIRDAVRCGASIRYLVPGAVEDYIRTHGLYRD